MEPMPSETSGSTDRYYRMPRYLSPSALKMWQSNRVQYYKNYLSPNKPPRDPQTKAMSVGSAFDAYAKSYLHHVFVNDNDPRFKFEALFEAQVEPHNRDTAREDGKKVYEAYIASGALQDLSLKLTGAIGKPTFETSLEGVVNGQRPSKEMQLGAVPLLGKPDLYFRTNKNIRITTDWKVNGFYSKSGVSPTKGYGRLYPSLDRHTDFYPVLFGDVTVNGMLKMEQVDADWADQLATYSWLLGEPVGSDFVVMIHQLVCRPTGIRVAELMMHVSEEYQHNLYEEYQKCWYRVQSGEIFDEMTAEQSLIYAKTLDNAPPVSDEMKSLYQEPSYYAKRTA